MSPWVIGTASARRVEDDLTRSLRGSHLTAGAHHLDETNLVDHLIALVAVGLIAVQPGGSPSRRRG